MKNYIRDAKRTEPECYVRPSMRVGSDTARILHGAIGISTEAGEILDAVKKHIYYGKDLDRVNLAEEVGDVLWYCAILLDQLGMSFEQAMEMNINKLQKRFPEKFSEVKAENRDLESERKGLENDFFPNN